MHRPIRAVMSDLQPAVLMWPKLRWTKHSPSLRQFMCRDSAAVHASIRSSTSSSSPPFPVINVVVGVVVVVVLRPRRRDPLPWPRRRPFGLLVGRVLGLSRSPRRRALVMMVVVVVVLSLDAVDNISTPMARSFWHLSLQYDEYTGWGKMKHRILDFLFLYLVHHIFFTQIHANS